MSKADTLKYLTIREVAADLSVSIEHVRNLCTKTDKQGRVILRSMLVGTGSKKHRRIHRQWLDEFKRDREQAALEAAQPAEKFVRAKTQTPNLLWL